MRPSMPRRNDANTEQGIKILQSHKYSTGKRYCEHTYISTSFLTFHSIQNSPTRSRYATSTVALRIILREIKQRWSSRRRLIFFPLWHEILGVIWIWVGRGRDPVFSLLGHVESDTSWFMLSISLLQPQTN